LLDIVNAREKANGYAIEDTAFAVAKNRLSRLNVP